MKNKVTEVWKKLMDKPYLFGVIITLLFMGAIKLVGLIFAPLDAVGDALAEGTLIILCIGFYTWFRIAFKKEIPHTFSVKSFFKGVLLLLPILSLSVLALIVSISSVLFGGSKFPSIGYILACLVSALEAGICEDIVLRGLFSGNAMRVKHESKNILLNAFLSAICFGLMHLLNLTSGAGVAATISQVMYATGFGLIFAAAFFRTGTIIPCIVVHFIIDFAQFFSAGVNEGTSETIGIMKDSNPVFQVVYGFVLLLITCGITLLYLRKKNHAEIISIFNVKEREN